MTSLTHNTHAANLCLRRRLDFLSKINCLMTKVECFCARGVWWQWNRRAMRNEEIDSGTSSLDVYWRLSEQTRHKNSSMPISTTLSAWTQLKSSVRYPKWIDDGELSTKTGEFGGESERKKWEINFPVKYPSIPRQGGERAAKRITEANLEVLQAVNRIWTTLR